MEDFNVRIGVRFTILVIQIFDSLPGSDCWIVTPRQRLLLSEFLINEYGISQLLNHLISLLKQIIFR